MNVTVLSDRVLLNNYLSGDRSAISELIERHSQRVRNYIGMMVKDDDIANDIFQETFIKAVQVIDEGRYVDSGKFLSWVLRIAHNRVLDYFRREKTSKQVNESEAGYDMIGTMRFSEPTAEDNLVVKIDENYSELPENPLPHWELAKKYDLNQGIIWDMMKEFERKIALKRGLI